MKKLTILVGLALAVALALPSSADATGLVEVKKLTASDAQDADQFGRSVAVSGDSAIVGAIRDAGGTFAGAAYVFERNQGGPGNWGQVKKLTASDAQAFDVFGWSVAISGDTAIVGAPFEGAGGSNAGAAYIFERNQGGPGNWGEVTKLTASDAQAGDQFGESVAVSGDTAVVGSYLEDARGSDAGAAYVFERDQGGPGNWGEVKKLTASDAQIADFFGFSVAINGETAMVGARGEDAGGSDAGAAYVFQRDQGGADTWGEVKKLAASDAQANDWFGWSVAVSGDAAVVGARFGDAVGAEAGAAYVFASDQGGAGNWGEVKKLTASDAQAGDRFGWSVAVSADTAIVGALVGDAPGPVAAAGAAYVFQRDQGGPDNWGEVKKLTASDAQAGDLFGVRVSISGDLAIVGAYAEDAGGFNAGAAYVFDALHDEQLNINVVRKHFGDKLAGTCWRISYGPAKVPHDVVGDDSGGVKPDCGEPSNLKLFDKDPSPGVLRITITSAQRIQFGDIWHAQMSFAPGGQLDTFNYECDLSLGKCEIGPVAVGGLVVDLDRQQDGLPLETPGSSGGNTGILAGVVATATAGALALGGAAWYARRRNHTEG